MWLALAIVAEALLPATALYLQGELPRSSEFSEFVGKFCYDWTTQGDTIGLAHFEVEAEARPPVGSGSHGLYVMVYDDEDKYWMAIREGWGGMACAEKREAANFARMVHLHGIKRRWEFTLNLTEHLRPRMWYFTFVNCGMNLTDVPLRYTIHTTNIKFGALAEFSVDRFGVPWLYVLAAACFLAAATRTSRAARAGDAPLAEHPYVKLLMLAFGASGASCACFVLHYTLFARDGFGSKRLRFLGAFGAVAANCTVFLVAILASRGWAITASALPHRRAFFMLVALAGSAHALCELHAELTVDQSARMFAYSGSGGLLALALKLLIFAWFALQARASHKEERHEARRRFYKRLGWSISAWACTVPLASLLAVELPPWQRYKWVTAFEVAARLAGLCLLSRLLCGPASPLSAENTFSMTDCWADDRAGPKLGA